MVYSKKDNPSTGNQYLDVKTVELSNKQKEYSLNGAIFYNLKDTPLTISQTAALGHTT